MKAKTTKSSDGDPVSISKWIHKFRQSKDDHTWWTTFGLILCLTMATRLYRLDSPDHVAWDETHFGKMASWYINRTFFFDVHPPTGKMLIAAFGYLTGYDGKFEFEKPGQKFNETHYLGMRFGCTMMGAALVPMAFITVWELTHALPAATFAAAAILFDNGMVTLNQYILLDPILMFFIMGAAMGQSKFYNQRHNPFTVSWWSWMAFTGAMLAGAISVKFVGLFVVVLVGLYTIKDIWDILGDLSHPITYTVKHFLARALCLILLPTVLYMFAYYVHFTVLSKSGPGDGHFGSAFQSQLEGNSLHNASMPREICYGAGVTLKNHRTAGAYLHSHPHLYPPEAGPVQQQVTTYSHKDYNNIWLVKRYDVDMPSEEEEAQPDFKPECVKSGDLIRLEHEATSRNLHSHRHPAPVTKRHFQVSGYGENGTGDSNDVWRIELVDGKEGDQINVVTDRFRLIHYMVGCALFSHNKQLPKWGYEQQEVTCNPNTRAEFALWNFEENYYDKLPNVSFAIYQPSFLEKFFEAHMVQFQGNAGLKPKEGEVTSRPWQWPIDYQGQWFSIGDPDKREPGPHKDHEIRIYMMGNPVIWWGNLGFIALYAVIYVWNFVSSARGVRESAQERVRKANLTYACNWLMLAWALHYFPFYGMGRILYYHHYFPAQLFISMMSGVLVNYMLESLPRAVPSFRVDQTWTAFAVVYLSILTYSFYLFAPLTYGMSGPEKKEPGHRYDHLLWMDSWEF
ncbi:protein O-mannosyl-transferase 2-like [Amphibalanus amphitrite]|uniref:protein O-mannosyl-transferase 2-like n=1 Tax=Amphibalanus amphitrite TaxID=1232801 RepID=UPI001C91CF1E|nr:protein O-mannosyl-transferase 2-like [Amphibalanus amphitrite]